MKCMNFDYEYYSMLNYRFTSPPSRISLGFTGQSEHLSYLSIIHVVGYYTMGFRIQALWINIPTYRYIVEWIKMEELGPLVRNN